MNYKGFSNKTKNRICRALGFLPDPLYLRVMYRIKTGRHLHLKKPVTFFDKINWLKLHDRNPLYTALADKYEVRSYVRERIGEEYLIPLLGVWKSFDEIDFARLPDAFVLKCTHDFGSAVIVNDRKEFDRKAAEAFISEELRYNFFYRGREWAYKNITPRIIAEKNMQEGPDRITDYKFFCFGGKVKYLFVAQGRGTDLRFDFFDRDYNHMTAVNEQPNADRVPEKPENYEEMIRLAEKLSAGINNVRVDLYNIGGKIYFSEMTFYHMGGMGTFVPYETDVQLGREFILQPY